MIKKAILIFGIVLVSACSIKSPFEDPSNAYPTRVYFGTDRASLGSDQPELAFGPDRGRVSYGIVELNAWPASDENGLVETSFVQASQMQAKPFFARLRSQDDPGESGKILLFVHGFKRNFSTAAENVARISEGIGFNGRTVFWSWPSLDNAGAYLSDRTSLQWTEAHLASFINDLVEKGDTRQFTLVAHSLGAEALTQALVERIGVKQLRDWKVIDNLVLLAPDIDLDIFRRDIAPALIRAGIPTTIYTSSTDLALITSSGVNGYPRVGDASDDVYSFAGIDTIDVSRVAKTGLRHSYYRRSPRVFADLRQLIVELEPVDRRAGLKRVKNSDKKYWEMRE